MGSYSFLASPSPLAAVEDALSSITIIGAYTGRRECLRMKVGRGSGCTLSYTFCLVETIESTFQVGCGFKKVGSYSFLASPSPLAAVEDALSSITIIGAYTGRRECLRMKVGRGSGCTLSYTFCLVETIESTFQVGCGFMG